MTAAPLFSLLTRDGKILFLTRTARLFAYGFLSVILIMYLEQAGLSLQAIGLLLTLALAGDAVITLWLTNVADRFGRRKTLIIGAGLMLMAGLVFAMTGNFILLVIAATIGVISPSGNEIGPFLSVEQAALAQTVPGQERIRVFAWYNLIGSFSTAAGALACGWIVQALQAMGWTPLSSYRSVVVGYAFFGLALATLFLFLSNQIEVVKRTVPQKTFLGLHKSRRFVFKLSALFSIDAFAGGFVIQSIIAYWFFARFQAEPAMLGSIFFGANLLAGVSALAAAWVARRIGLINTMVFTHLPSNILLILVPLMPNLWLAILMLLLRYSISQMDVPTRQAYTMAAVDPDERSAASGVTAIARSVGAAISPVLAGPFMATAALAGIPFFIGGGLKIVYDLLLYRTFSRIKLPSGER